MYITDSNDEPIAIPETPSPRRDEESFGVYWQSMHKLKTDILLITCNYCPLMFSAAVVEQRLKNSETSAVLKRYLSTSLWTDDEDQDENKKKKENQGNTWNKFFLLANHKVWMWIIIAISVYNAMQFTTHCA